MLIGMRPDLDLVAEATRRLLLALIAVEGELCVCELVAATHERQPYVSRHLALLREGGWLDSRREGTFVHYRIARVPGWALQVIDALQRGGVEPGQLREATERLAHFAGRPVRGRAA